MPLILRPMKNQKEFIIPYVGLSLGNHEFQFKVEQPFFDLFDYADLNEANIDVQLTLEKQSTMLVLYFTISGNVRAECSRCMDLMSETAEGSYKLIARFTDEDYEETEEIINLPSSVHEIDVSSYIYEFCMLSLPASYTHEEGDCNPEMIGHLQNYLVDGETSQTTEEQSDDEIDPRWEALKKLKKK